MIRNFNSKEELILRAKQDNACEKGLAWAGSQTDLASIIKNMPQDYRWWCLKQGYIQFVTLFNWNTIDNVRTMYLQNEQPEIFQFINK